MTRDLSPIDRAKYAAAKRAAQYVKSGMKVGLGTGSTAKWLVEILGEMVRDDGLSIRAVPTSARTAGLAEAAGITSITLDEAKSLDLTIDGADEYDAEMNLIKGGGGALLHEKIVATASERMIVIADASKKVDTLGAYPLPVEVIPFGWQTTKALVEEALIGMDVLGRAATWRMNGDEPFASDEGNLILDLNLNRIGDPRQLSLVLNQIPGIVENGLFIDICDAVVLGYGDGTVIVNDLDADGVEESRIDVEESDNIFAED